MLRFLFRKRKTRLLLLQQVYVGQIGEAFLRYVYGICSLTQEAGLHSNQIIPCCRNIVYFLYSYILVRISNQF